MRIGECGAVEGFGSGGLVDARGVREVEGLGRRGRGGGGSGGSGGLGREGFGRRG